MLITIIYVQAIIISAMAINHQSVDLLDKLNHQNVYHKKFLAFIQKFQKNYKNTDEALERYQIFEQNLQLIIKHQKMQPKARFGITRFSDLSNDEFTKNQLYAFQKGEENNATQKHEIIPEKFDWRKYNVVGEVRDQFDCESCWAFSVVQNIESQYYLRFKERIVLSAKQLVDCDYNDQRCRGGHIISAYQFLIAENEGLMTEIDYPFIITNDLSCHYSEEKPSVKINSFEKISTDEYEIAVALLNKGPLSVALNSEYLQFYKSGILQALNCDPTPNHAVLIVGYDLHNVYKYLLFTKDGTQYWIVKNQWGKKWGIDGYFYIEKGNGACGINLDVSVVNNITKLEVPPPNPLKAFYAQNN